MSLVARLLRQRDAGAVARRRARLHDRLVDHAILRRLWTNMDQIAPGVWRSNRPMHRRLVALKAMGLRSVLNLRGGVGDWFGTEYDHAAFGGPAR